MLCSIHSALCISRAPLRVPRTRRSAASPQVNFEGPELHAALAGKGCDPEHASLCRQFFLYLALCHTVVTEVVDGEKRLSASSPDESALVAAAAYFGYEFVDRHQDEVRVVDHLKGGKVRAEHDCTHVRTQNAANKRRARKSQKTGEGSGPHRADSRHTETCVYCDTFITSRSARSSRAVTS